MTETKISNRIRKRLLALAKHQERVKEICDLVEEWKPELKDLKNDDGKTFRELVDRQGKVVTTDVSAPIIESLLAKAKPVEKEPKKEKPKDPATKTKKSAQEQMTELDAKDPKAQKKIDKQITKAENKPLK